MTGALGGRQVRAGEGMRSLRLLESQHIFYRATACSATHGIAKAFLSVISSVCQSDKCVRPLLREILVRLTLLERKRRFSINIRL